MRRPFRRWDVCLEVDGQLHVFEEGPQHTVAVSPGPHRVSVWFRGAGLAILARWLRYGRRSVDVTVDPGGVTRLTYEGSTLWHMGGRAELVVSSSETATR